MAGKDKRVHGTKGGDVRIVGLGPHTYALSGRTLDYDTKAIIPGCAVHLFRTSDDLEIAQTVSDSVGHYSFTGLPNTTTEYYIVAYKSGAPDIAGTTLNTLKAA